MEWIIFVCLAAGMLALIIWGAVVHQRKVRANLAALADRHGLRVVGGGRGITTSPEITGEIQGKAVRFWTYATGSGKSRRTWCAVGVRPRGDGGLTFEIQRQGFATKVMEWFGAKEVRVGDERFDAEWFLRTNQPEFFAAALVPEIRARLDRLGAVSGDSAYKLERGLVQFATGGSFGHDRVVARLEARLPLLLDLADMAEVYAASRSQ